jgi:chorismate mutase
LSIKALRAACAFGSLIIALLGGCATPAAPADPITELLNLIEQRLAIGAEVARSKWNSGAAIEDLKRESEIVDAIGAQAASHGLEPTLAKQFFQAQIEASKMIQNARLAQWRATQQPAFSDAPDLLRDIRPQLDRLTPAILDALAKALPALHAPATRARLNNYADNAARRAAMAPLLEVAPQN